MKNIVKALLIVIGISLILIVLSVKAFPEWLTIPGGLLILLGVAFNTVLDAGGKIKGWIDLLESKNNTSKEGELKRNLDLKRRVQQDFGEWLNYALRNRKRSSKIILRAFDGAQYPASNEPDEYGEYSWFAANVKSIYHNGIEFIHGGIESLVIYEDNKWDFAKNAKDSNLETISVYRVGRINFSDIVDYDLKGDEHYPCPHFFLQIHTQRLAV